MKFHSTKETFNIIQISIDVITLKTSVINILQYSLRGQGSKAIMEFAFEIMVFACRCIYEYEYTCVPCEKLSILCEDSRITHKIRDAKPIKLLIYLNQLFAWGKCLLFLTWKIKRQRP